MTPPEKPSQPTIPAEESQNNQYLFSDLSMEPIPGEHPGGRPTLGRKDIDDERRGGNDNNRTHTEKDQHSAQGHFRINE